MILQDEKVIIYLGGLVFSSHEMPGPHYRLDPDAIEGWFDGAPMRRGEDARPTQWGDFETPGYLGNRPISLTGTAIASSFYNASGIEMLQAMRDEFMSVLVKGDFIWMEVNTTSAGSRFIKVGMDTRPKWVRRTDTFANFKMDLVAADPRVYGVKRTYTIPARMRTGGLRYPMTYAIDYNGGELTEAETMMNNGNVDAWPVITVRGNLPEGFRIKNSAGKTVEYTGFASNAAPVVIDFAEGSATQNRRDRTFNLTKRDWFGIAPQDKDRYSLEYINDGFGGVMVVSIRDTWI